MAKRSFSVPPRYAPSFTPNLGPIESPYFMVTVGVWDGAAFRPDERFLWDTGSNFCIVPREFAVDHGFRLHDTDDRLDRPLGGIGGDVPTWLTTRYVRFPLLSGRPDLKFRFHFLVIDQELDFPIPGITDVLANFVVESSWEETVFRLRPDHDGIPA